MNTPELCPVCQKPLALHAPRGLCPECLLKAGFPTGTQPPDEPRQPRTVFVPPEPATLAPLFPQLEILGLIGQGGMGAVYRARQTGLDRIVALKILPPQAADDPGFAERFTREARALAQLNHPHIVAVHEFGKSGGYHFLLMEYVDGVNLRRLLESGRTDPRAALAIVPQICDALQFAHDRGIVHRDIKPENILLDKTGTVKIADFGLAKIMGSEPHDTVLTGARDVMGTPHYMAPEQVERPLTVDHRADIYSVGVVFYQMLTGELPIGRFAVPSKKVRIDVRLDEIVLRALEKEPELRFQQASALRTEVETVAGGNPVTADPPGQPTRSFFGNRLLVIGANRSRFYLGLLTGIAVAVAFLLATPTRYQAQADLALPLKRVVFATPSPTPAANQATLILAGSMEEVALAIRNNLPLLTYVANAVSQAVPGTTGLDPRAIASALMIEPQRGSTYMRLKVTHRNPALVGPILREVLAVLTGNTQVPFQVGSAPGAAFVVMDTTQPKRQDIGGRLAIAYGLIALGTLGGMLWAARGNAPVAPDSSPQLVIPVRRVLALGAVVSLLLLVGWWYLMLQPPEIAPRPLAVTTGAPLVENRPIPSPRPAPPPVGGNSGTVPANNPNNPDPNPAVAVRPDPAPPSNPAPRAQALTLLTAEVSQADYDRMESDPAILRLQINAAMAARLEAIQLLRAGVITANDLELYNSKLALLQDRLAGEPVNFARTVLTAAERIHREAISRFDVGLITSRTLAEAQLAVDAARIRLEKASELATRAKAGSALSGAGTSAGFDPVVELTLGDVATNQLPELIDFDTGRTFLQRDVLEGATSRLNAAAIADKFREHGIDATGTLDPNTKGLAVWECLALPIGTEFWLGTTPTELGPVPARLAELFVGQRAGSVAVMAGTGPLPATYAIMTHSGRMGLVQILGFSDQPRGVKIRYKLIAAALTAP